MARRAYDVKGLVIHLPLTKLAAVIVPLRLIIIGRVLKRLDREALVALVLHELGHCRGPRYYRDGVGVALISLSSGFLLYSAALMLARWRLWYAALLLVMGILPMLGLYLLDPPLNFVEQVKADLAAISGSNPEALYRALLLCMEEAGKEVNVWLACRLALLKLAVYEPGNPIIAELARRLGAVPGSC